MSLYTNPQQIERARAQRESAPFDAAFAALSQREDPLSLATRHAFLEDMEAGQRAMQTLTSGHGPHDLSQQAHLAALLSHTPAFADALSAWQQTYADKVRAYVAVGSASRYDIMLLRVAAGRVLNDDALFGEGVAMFEATIREDLHPEGYLRSAVKATDGGTFARSLAALRALVLTAEAATQAGRDLWSLEDRGVSVLTAAQYMIFYYFYPDKWRWEAGPDEARVRHLYHTEGAFMEMVHYRAQPQGLTELLRDEQRPMFSVWGGWTTLSHGLPLPEPKPRRRFGLFRRG